MPWYRRKAFWLAVIGLAAVLTLIQALIEALSGQSLS